MDDVDDAKGAAAERPEDGHGGHGPEDELEVEVVRHVRAAVRFADGHGEDGVGDHPRDDHVRAHGAVIVLLLLGLADAVSVDLDPVPQVPERFVVPAVDIELFARHLQLDRVAFAADCGTEVNVDDVVAFGAPGHVVGVAEGVDLEGADVGGEEGEVLCRGGEHVPGVEIEEGHEEVEADSGGCGYHEVGEEIVTEFEGCAGRFELQDDNV